jgi:hypothetical protein
MHAMQRASACVSVRQRASACVSVRQRASACVRSACGVRAECVRSASECVRVRQRLRVRYRLSECVRVRYRASECVRVRYRASECGTVRYRAVLCNILILSFNWLSRAQRFLWPHSQKFAPAPSCGSRWSAPDAAGWQATSHPARLTISQLGLWLGMCRDGDESPRRRSPRVFAAHSADESAFD